MSDRLSKKERRRSSSSSSFSSTSSENSNDAKAKTKDKTKEQPRPINSLGNVNKVRLDIGYKIQQEELTDSEESVDNTTSPRARSKSNDILNYCDKKRERSQSHERRYRSRSNEKRRERSHSKDFRKDRSQSKDIKQDLKPSSKYDLKTLERKDRSKSKDSKRERSRSRDRRKRGSKSKEHARSLSKERKRDRSRSREKRRDRSRSKDRKEKRRDRSRSRERHREKSRRDSRSPCFYKSRTHPKRRSRERSSKRSRSRSRSRSRPRKRSRSRSISFDRSKRLYDKKLNKLNILEKLGIELKVPETGGEAGANTSGFSIPSYYNPAGVNPLKYAQQMQKRRLIWGTKKQEGEGSTEKKEEEKKPEVGPESVWKGTTFSQDQDGKLTAKFKRLMGIKDSGGEEGSSDKNSELIQKQEEMFTSMEKQYEVARVSTHTHRGLGLGFGVHLPR